MNNDTNTKQQHELQHHVAQLLALQPQAETDAEEQQSSSQQQQSQNITLEAISHAHAILRILNSCQTHEQYQALTVSSIFPSSRTLFMHPFNFLQSAPHQLNFILIRLMKEILECDGEGECIAVFCEQDEKEKDREVRKEQNNAAAYMSILIGLLRMSDVPLLTSELIELLGVLFGVDMDESYIAESSAVAIQLHTHLVHAFLGSTSRNVLLLIKHLGDIKLTEEVRLKLLKMMYACCTSGQTKSSTNARRILEQSSSRWSENVLPPLPQIQNDGAISGENEHDPYIKKQRKKQLMCIREIRAILQVCK